MFSYRHAFHAGNHADVLKHTCLIALMKYLTQKDTALTVIDTHAGAGLYRLDGDYTETSGEASEGIFKLITAAKAAQDMERLQGQIASSESGLRSAVQGLPGQLGIDVLQRAQVEGSRRAGFGPAALPRQALCSSR